MLILPIALFYTLSFLLKDVNAQVLVNGQVFTNGLAIIDSPAPNSILHAGASATIAIDVSGDGHLPSSATTGNTSQSTRFDSLEVYITSYQTSVNLTVSKGPGLLTQEPGSTVKHLNGVIDNCLPNGAYNISFYEYAHISGNPYFTVTNLPVSIQNTQPSGPCTNGTNPISTSQASSSLAHSPWLNSTGATITANLPSPTSSASPLTPMQAGPVLVAILAMYIATWNIV